MAISSQGCTVTFSGFSANVTSISVEEPQPEIVDMTGISGARQVVPTGDFVSPGRIRLDYLRSSDSAVPAGGTSGTLSISGPGGVSVTGPAVVESSSTELAVGELVRGSIGFVFFRS